jgi:Flp pilus assembly pilin Flp
MLPFVRRLLADQRAVSVVEYTLIVALIASVSIGAFSAVRRSVMNMLGPAANAMT